MLDIKRIRTNKEEIIESLNSRFGNYNIDKVLELDEKRREIIFEVENKKARQNEVSKQVPKLKKDGVDVSDLFKEMKALSDEIKELDVKVKDLDEEIRKELNFTSLKFNRLDDMLDSVGIDKCKLCTYCWDGKE